MLAGCAKGAIAHPPHRSGLDYAYGGRSGTGGPGAGIGRATSRRGAAHSSIIRIRYVRPRRHYALRKHATVELPSPPSRPSRSISPRIPTLDLYICIGPCSA